MSASFSCRWTWATGGVAEDDQQTDQEAGLQPVQTIQKSGREACWQQLGVDLLASNKSLGPDTAAHPGAPTQVQPAALLSPHRDARLRRLARAKQPTSGTRRRMRRRGRAWRTWTAEQQAAAGRKSEQCGTQYSLVPPYIKQDRLSLCCSRAPSPPGTRDRAGQ